MAFTYAGLFSGIGGLELACEMLGGEPVFMCEQDEFCQRVLTKRFPNIPIFSDVREVTRDSVKEITWHRHNRPIPVHGGDAQESLVDVLVGGF